MEYPEYISKTEAKKLVAERTCSHPANTSLLRVEKNKISGHLDTRLKKGEITANESGLLLFLGVSKYAKQKFPGKFDDWPSAPNEIKVEMGGWRTKTSAFGINLPNEVGECHRLIGDLHKETLRLTDLNTGLKAEVERWKLDAEKGATYKKIKGGRDKP
ncbi:MAG: hypothetical protein HOP36_13645 [Methyloglobulus sp.]|nr:hypothetical protein [Methyloglobulus sp.]